MKKSPLPKRKRSNAPTTVPKASALGSNPSALGSTATVPKVFTLGSKVALPLLLTLILCGVFFLAPNKIGFLSYWSEDSTLTSHILFPLYHANIFHLACNLLCLWTLRPPYYILPAIIISCLASFLPCPVLALNGSILGAPSLSFSQLPIMGLSGILFAIIGIKWGRVHLFRQMIRRTWLFFAITAFIPNVACLFHLYCIMAGYLYGHIKYK